MKVFNVLVISLVILTGCASSEVEYAPASGPDSAGYTEQQISGNRYRVVFTGNDRSTVETVQNYALLRAAELTVQKDFDWFRVADRNTVTLQGDTNSTTALIAQGNQVQTDCGLLGCRTRQVPQFSGTQVRSPADGNRYSSNLEIVMVEQAEQNDDVYNAREVIENLRATF